MLPFFPAQIIDGGSNKKQDPAYGADVLRLWASSVDYSGDVCVGNMVIKQVHYRQPHRDAWKISSVVSSIWYPVQSNVVAYGNDVGTAGGGAF